MAYVGKTPPPAGNKGAAKTVKVGQAGPPTVTPCGASQPGPQGKKSAGKK